MQTYKVLPDDLRDSNLACHYGNISLKQVPVKYNLPSRSVREALDDLNAVNELIKWSDQKPLIQNAKRKQATKWASKYAKYESKDRELYTEFELKISLLRYQLVISKWNLDSEYNVTMATNDIATTVQL